MQPILTFDRGDTVQLAYRHRLGHGPTIVFLPGYMSDMDGSKAVALENWAAATGRAFVRFDYSGCGASGGAFTDGTISRWRDDALAVLSRIDGPLLLVGSSMGGWVALLVALACPGRLRGLVTIAGAPDFTDWGLDLTDAERAGVALGTAIERPSAYGTAPYIYTAGLIVDGTANRLLGREIAVDVPVRLLHGQADRDVPWQLSVDVAAVLRSSDVQVTLIKDGDHRLSRGSDLNLLCTTLDQLLEA